MLNPSFAQIIHNLSALIMYLFVPFFIISIGLAIKKTRYLFSIQSIILGLFSLILIYLFSSNLTSEFKGLYQRAIEMLFIIWTILSSIEINKASILKS